MHGSGVIFDRVDENVTENLAFGKNEADGLPEHGSHHDSKKQQKRDQR